MFEAPFKKENPPLHLELRSPCKSQSTNPVIAGLCILGCSSFVDDSLCSMNTHTVHLFLGAFSNFGPLKTNSKCALAKQCLTKRKCRLFCLLFLLFPAHTQCPTRAKLFIAVSLAVCFTVCLYILPYTLPYTVKPTVRFTVGLCIISMCSIKNQSTRSL